MRFDKDIHIDAADIAPTASWTAPAAAGPVKGGLMFVTLGLCTHREFCRSSFMLGYSLDGLLAVAEGYAHIISYCSWKPSKFGVIL